jgi:hypothetical protein
VQVDAPPALELTARRDPDFAIASFGSFGVIWGHLGSSVRCAARRTRDASAPLPSACALRFHRGKSAAHRTARRESLGKPREKFFAFAGFVLRARCAFVVMKAQRASYA